MELFPDPARWPKTEISRTAYRWIGAIATNFVYVAFAALSLLASPVTEPGDWNVFDTLGLTVSVWVGAWLGDLVWLRQNADR